MYTIHVFVLCVAAAAAVPSRSQRIVGGSAATISQYPTIASLLYSWDLSNYWQSCGGTILTTRSILTAAHCPYGDTANKWRVRVGSSYANSRGVVHTLASIVIHSGYNYTTLNNDIAIMRTASTITYVTNAVQPAAIAGANYNLGDNQVVWAAGWGTVSVGGAASEQLRHVQIWTINQSVCTRRYANLGYTVTDNMLCIGWLDVGGRDQCQGDSGGPLYHNGNVVGVCSWGYQCALALYPGVNTRVSRYTSWIQANAQNQQRIVGGIVTTISQYPTIAGLLYSQDLNSYWLSCGGTILTGRSVLTAAHCPAGDGVNRWRVRVGSTFANSGGFVHILNSVIIHPNYNPTITDNDIAILRTATTISYVTDAVQPALIAGVNYNLADNQVVWAAGWGTTSPGGQPSEQLRHVQIWSVNQDICVERYREVSLTVTDNMLCSGWLDQGGRDQCQGDSGGPLYHNNVVVGVCSWGRSCALPRYPGVNARVSRFTTWIASNA